MDIRLSDALLPASLAAGEERHTPRERRLQLRFSNKDGGSTHARAVRDTLVRAVLALVFAVLAAAALFYSVVQAFDAYSLAQNYQAVEGRVVQTQCASHLQVGYAFEAGGLSFHGSGMAHKRCDAYRTGDPVTVYFSPGNPVLSLSEVSPVQEWHTRLALLLTECAVLVVIGLMFGLRKAG